MVAARDIALLFRRPLLRCLGVVAATLLSGQASAQRFNYAPRVSGGEPVYLYLDAMASLPGNVVLLGGSFRSASDPLHTGLLVSRDDGRTWTTAPVKLEDSGIRAIATAGTRHIWALATVQKEGSDDPAFVVSSTDAGKSWRTLPLPVPRIGGIAQVREFRFLDQRHGLLVLESSNGKGAVYSTSDAGRRWKVLWSTSPGLVDEYRYPAEPVPLHATLWRSVGGEQKESGLLRVLRDEVKPQSYRIQQYRLPSMDWEDVGSISARYRVEGGELHAAGN